MNRKELGRFLACRKYHSKYQWLLLSQVGCILAHFFLSLYNVFQSFYSCVWLFLNIEIIAISITLSFSQEVINTGDSLFKLITVACYVVLWQLAEMHTSEQGCFAFSASLSLCWWNSWGPSALDAFLWILSVGHMTRSRLC